MNKLLKILEKNPKIDYIKKFLKPSLSDENTYKEFRIVLKTTRSLYDQYKSIYITTSDLDDRYNISFISNINPIDTPLKKIYLTFKIKDWEKSQYAHENSKVFLRISTEDLNKVINYYYSSINS